MKPLDIFKLEKDGGLIWKGTAENFEIAKLGVQGFVANSPGEYVIFSQETQDKLLVKVDGTTEKC
jgi:hypothetical protein